MSGELDGRTAIVTGASAAEITTGSRRRVIGFATTPEAVIPPVAWLAAQIATGYTGRIIDASDFGSTWP